MKVYTYRLTEVADTICPITGVTTFLVVLYLFIVSLVMSIGSDFDLRTDWPLFVILPVGFIPLFLALVARRRHLLGGLAIVMFTVAFIPFALVRIYSDEFSARWVFYTAHSVIGILFFTGGVLHLAVWWKERQRERLQHN